MASQQNDCYYFYYSSCAKGDSCPFRHEPAALGTETICDDWRYSRCSQVECPLRHMEVKKNRKTISCYWESQPGGCQKTHCPFMHRGESTTITITNDLCTSNGKGAKPDQVSKFKWSMGNPVQDQIQIPQPLMQKDIPQPLMQKDIPQPFMQKDILKPLMQKELTVKGPTVIATSKKRVAQSKGTIGSNHKQEDLQTKWLNKFKANLTEAERNLDQMSGCQEAASPKESIKIKTLEEIKAEKLKNAESTPVVTMVPSPVSATPTSSKRLGNGSSSAKKVPGVPSAKKVPAKKVPEVPSGRIKTLEEILAEKYKITPGQTEKKSDSDSMDTSMTEADGTLSTQKKPLKRRMVVVERGGTMAKKAKVAKENSGNPADASLAKATPTIMTSAGVSPVKPAPAPAKATPIKTTPIKTTPITTTPVKASTTTPVKASTKKRLKAKSTKTNKAGSSQNSSTCDVSAGDVSVGESQSKSPVKSDSQILPMESSSTTSSAAADSSTIEKDVDFTMKTDDDDELSDLLGDELLANLPESAELDDGADIDDEEFLLAEEQRLLG